jgi:hypothetical protein
MKIVQKFIFYLMSREITQFFKIIYPLQAIEIKMPPAGNCCQHAIFYPDNAGYDWFKRIY